MRYVVRAGEDINSISERFRANPSEVASLNLIEGNLTAGDIIELPAETSQPIRPPGYAVGGAVGRPPVGGPVGQLGIPEQEKPKKPPIFGQPMPDAGMRRPTMGQIKQPPQKLSPGNYAQEEQSKKRLRGMGGGKQGMMRPGQGKRPGGAQQQGQRGGSEMLDQLWSNLGPQRRGFAAGGPVSSPPQDISKYQDIYGKKMAELRSGGEGGTQGAPARPGGIGGIPQNARGGPSRPPMGRPPARGPSMGRPPMGAPPMGRPSMGGPPMGGPSGRPRMGPRPGGLPKAPRGPAPIGGGIASVGQGKQPRVDAVEESTKSVRAGIMAAASIPSLDSGARQPIRRGGI